MRRKQTGHACAVPLLSAAGLTLSLATSAPAAPSEPVGTAAPTPPECHETYRPASEIQILSRKMPKPPSRLGSVGVQGESPAGQAD